MTIYRNIRTDNAERLHPSRLTAGQALTTYRRTRCRWYRGFFG